MQSSKIRVATGDALVAVDVQNDFLPGGALAVPEGNLVIPPLNLAIELFNRRGLALIFTRDWHPAEHASFHSQGGPWPAHCLADSPGARFATSLVVPDTALTISKATTPQAEAYSAFDGTRLAALLHSLDVRRLFVGGLATEHCVLATVRDALKLGFRTVLLRDAVRAIDHQRGEQAIAEMVNRGAIAATTNELA